MIKLKGISHWFGLYSQNQLKSNLMKQHMYNIDVKECLYRGEKFLGEDNKYEGCVRAVLAELKAHKGEKCVLDVGCIKIEEIRNEIADVIRKILFSEEAKDVDLYLAFNSKSQRERLKELTPDLNWIDLGFKEGNRLISTVAD